MRCKLIEYIYIFYYNYSNVGHLIFDFASVGLWLKLLTEVLINVF